MTSRYTVVHPINFSTLSTFYFVSVQELTQTGFKPSSPEEGSTPENVTQVSVHSDPTHMHTHSHTTTHKMYKAARGITNHSPAQQAL